MKDLLKHALEGNVKEIQNALHMPFTPEIPFEMLVKAYLLTYRRSIKLKHKDFSQIELVKTQRERALKHVTQNIDETLIDQGKKNHECSQILYEQLQYKMTEHDHANQVALMLCKINDDSFYNHCLLYNVFINYNYKKDDHTMLHVAAKYGHVDIVKYLLTQDIDYTMVHKTTPLHYAVKNHHVEVVKLLCDSVNINIKDEHGYSALYYVSPGKNGNITLFEYLINHGANINIKHHGKTLLYHAVTNNHFPTVEYLLSKGANPYTSCKIENNKSKVYDQHYELCINIAINKYYLNIPDQVSNYRIIMLLSTYMKLH